VTCLSEVFGILILAEVAEMPIRERALEKLGSRGKDLQSLTTPMQLFREYASDLPILPTSHRICVRVIGRDVGASVSSTS